MSGKSTFSILGADVAVKGDIRAATDLHIDGEVEGDIACASLVQGAESRIKGSIVAQAARLSGHIEGAISVGELVIEASARITGDVTYESISVAPGSQVDGRFTHRRGAGSAEAEALQIPRGEVGAVGIGNVLGKHRLARLMPAHGRLEHRKEWKTADHTLPGPIFDRQFLPRLWLTGS